MPRSDIATRGPQTIRSIQASDSRSPWPGCQSKAAAAAPSSPVGMRRTIDDKPGKPTSIMQITEDNGVLTGKIVELLEGATETTCSKYEGDLPEKRHVGKRILWDLKRQGNAWTDGKVFNSAGGGTYTSRARLTDGGKTLNVTGTCMFFSKRQQWQRVK